MKQLNVRLPSSSFSRDRLQQMVGLSGSRLRTNLNTNMFHVCLCVYLFVCQMFVKHKNIRFSTDDVFILFTNKFVRFLKKDIGIKKSQMVVNFRCGVSKIWDVCVCTHSRACACVCAHLL